MSNRYLTSDEIETILFNLQKRIDLVDNKDSLFCIKYTTKSKNQKYNERQGYLDVLKSIHGFIYCIKDSTTAYHSIQRFISETAVMLTKDRCFSYCAGVNNAIYRMKSMIHGVKKEAEKPNGYIRQEGREEWIPIIVPKNIFGHVGFI